MNHNMSIDEMITYLQVQVFRRKFGAGQHTELVSALERECSPADVRAVVKDYEWFHVPGRAIPSPHEIRLRCLEEKRSRLRRAQESLRGKRGVADAIDDLEAQSYTHCVYLRAMMLLIRERRLHDLTAHEDAVRRAIEQIGEPPETDYVREVGLENSKIARQPSGPVSERLRHLQQVVNEVVNEAVHAVDYNPFDDDDLFAPM